MGGWFGNFARTVGSAGNETATAMQNNQDLARQASADKLKNIMSGLQIQELRQKISQAGQPGVDKESLRQTLLSRANDPNATSRDKKVYSQWAEDLSFYPPETIMGQMMKYETEPAEKPTPSEKAGEYKPYTVKGPDGKPNLVLASQIGEKIVGRDGKELPADAVPFEKPTKESYNASEEIHKEHPNWTPEQILEATQRPSFPRLAPVNDAKGNTIGWNYFQGEPGGKVSTKFIPANAGGAPLGESGGVIPPKPTSTTLTMAQMATTVLPEAKRVSSEVDSLAKQLGPSVGRWNELMVGKIGKDNPKVAMLQTDLKLLASAIVRTHFGGRGGQEYIGGMEDYFRLAQSPGDLKARIASANEWLTTYSEMAGGGAQGGGQTQSGASSKPKGTTHFGIGSVDKKKHWLDEKGNDLGLAE